MNEFQIIATVVMGVIIALVFLGSVQKKQTANEQRLTPEERAFLNPQNTDAEFKQTMPFDVMAAVKGGRTLEAVKLYRTQFNCSLKEAKDAIDRLRSTLK